MFKPRYINTGVLKEMSISGKCWHTRGWMAIDWPHERFYGTLCSMNSHGFRKEEKTQSSKYPQEIRQILRRLKRTMPNQQRAVSFQGCEDEWSNKDPGPFLIPRVGSQSPSTNGGTGWGAGVEKSLPPRPFRFVEFWSSKRLRLGWGLWWR